MYMISENVHSTCFVQKSYWLITTVSFGTCLLLLLSHHFMDGVDGAVLLSGIHICAVKGTIWHKKVQGT